MNTPEAKPITVHAHRLGPITAGVEARTWETTLAITGQQPVNAPAPTEMLIGALAACMIAGIQREGSAAGLHIGGVEVTARANRQMTGNGPLLKDFQAHIIVTSADPEEKLLPILEALHRNGSVTNTIQLGQPIEITYEVKQP